MTRGRFCTVLLGGGDHVGVVTIQIAELLVQPGDGNGPGEFSLVSQMNLQGLAVDLVGLLHVFQGLVHFADLDQGLGHVDGLAVSKGLHGFDRLLVGLQGFRMLSERLVGGSQEMVVVLVARYTAFRVLEPPQLQRLLQVFQGLLVPTGRVANASQGLVDANAALALPEEGIVLKDLLVARNGVFKVAPRLVVPCQSELETDVPTKGVSPKTFNVPNCTVLVIVPSGTKNKKKEQNDMNESR